jgi:AMMECR1 domain-containing protein
VDTLTAVNEEQKDKLLEVARDAVKAAVTGAPMPKPESDDPELNGLRGCFVTLKNRGGLRGCIGQFVADKPLIRMIAEMARASATGDPRFTLNPITAVR